MPLRIAGNGREFPARLKNSASLRRAGGASGAMWVIEQPRARSKSVDFWRELLIYLPHPPLDRKATNLLRCGKVRKIIKNAAKSLHRMSNR